MNGEIRKKICVAEEDKRLCQVIVCAAFLACIISIINSMYFLENCSIKYTYSDFLSYHAQI